MTSADATASHLTDALTKPARGVVGVVDDLLATCPPEGLRLWWQQDACHAVKLGSTPTELTRVSLRKSAFRAVLARVAVLCNASGETVSPYGGRGIVTTEDSGRRFHVEFVNTADDQHCDLAPAAPLAIPSDLARKPVWGVRGQSSPAAGFADLMRSLPLGAPLDDQAESAPRTVSLTLSDDPSVDPPGLALTAEQTARYYTRPDVTHIGTELVATQVPGGWWRPTLRVLPGPDREPLSLLVEFPDGVVRGFVIPVGQPGDLREVESEPGEAVTPTAFEAPATGWQGTVAIR